MLSEPPCKLSRILLVSDRVIIMYAGRIVETCRASELARARHPYTRGLLASLPRVDQPRDALAVLQREAGWRDEESVDARLD